MWLLVLLACAEEEGVVTAKGTALDVVEFEVTCDGDYVTIPGLLDRGTPVTLQGYYEEDDGSLSGVVRWNPSSLDAVCQRDSGTKMRVIATYPAE